MSYNLTPYVSKVFSIDVLSYLNVDTDGDVVTAETWRALWNNFINFSNSLDKHLTELLGDNGVIINLSNEVNALSKEHAIILADYTVIKEKFDELDAALSATNEALTTAQDLSNKAQAQVNALNDGLVHYGSEEPTNPNIKLWIHETDSTSLPASQADVNAVSIDLSMFKNTVTYQHYTKRDVDSKIGAVQQNLNQNISNVSSDLSAFKNTVTNEYYTKGEVDALDAVLSEYITNVETDVAQVAHDKQDTLVSGTNIKTINGESILGEGDIPISGGDTDLTNYVKKTDIASGDSAGVVKLKGSEGIWLNGDALTINQANKSRIDSRANKFPLVPAMLDYAIKVGLTTNTETLTNEEKAAAQSWLGITDLIGDIETLLGGI